MVDQNEDLSLENSVLKSEVKSAQMSPIQQTPPKHYSVKSEDGSAKEDQQYLIQSGAKESPKQIDFNSNHLPILSGKSSTSKKQK